MIDTYKKLFYPESSQKEFQIMGLMTYEHKRYHRKSLGSYCSLLEDQETTGEKTLVFQRSRSEFQTKAVLIQKKFGGNSSESQTESQFENLFRGCSDWEIPYHKISLKKKSTMDTQMFDEKESDYFFKPNAQEVQKFVNNQDEEKNLISEYDQNQWFDTDCSEYESELF